MGKFLVPLFILFSFLNHGYADETEKVPASPTENSREASPANLTVNSPVNSPLNSAAYSPCKVSVVEITQDGFARAPAAVAEFQSATAKGGECADEMKKHIKAFANNCHAPHHVLATISFSASDQKAVEAEVAMECSSDSKRRPASDSEAQVNRYINEAYIQLQTTYDRHPLTNVKLRSPMPTAQNQGPRHGQTDYSRPDTSTNGIIYGGENVNADKKEWLNSKSNPGSATLPDEVVQTRIHERQIAAAEERQYIADQNAYIQEFIQNAKADGWSIKVKDGRINLVPRN